MIQNDNLELRHALPRWLSISKALETGIFARAGKVKISLDQNNLRKDHDIFLRKEFEKVKNTWKKSNSLIDAEELLSVAVVSKNIESNHVINAAKQIVESLESNKNLIDFAKSVIEKNPYESDQNDAKNNLTIAGKIRLRKKILKTYPRDSLLLVETALYYANLGQLSTSEKLLRQAIFFSPNNRFVLRSAARFLCHDERPDEALNLLRHSPRLNTDPWLKSAELAISGMINAPIRGWRNSRTLALDNALSPRDRSELSTEIATFEFSAGAYKAGLKQIRCALQDPTENATAQVEFLAGKTKELSAEEFLPDLSSSMEAQTYYSYRKGNLEVAFDACEAWHKIEPFSIRPAIFGSFLSTSKHNSIDRGITLAKAGLISNPHNATLLNNIAVLLAYKGDIENAQRFSKQAIQSSEKQNDIANIATQGLLKFRSGDFSNAISDYKVALEKAIDKRDFNTAVRAYAFLAREISRIDSSMKQSFHIEFEKLRTMLSKTNRELPKDVALIATEFSEVEPRDLEQTHNTYGFSKDYMLETLAEAMKDLE